MLHNSKPNAQSFCHPKSRSGSGRGCGKTCWRQKPPSARQNRQPVPLPPTAACSKLRDLSIHRVCVRARTMSAREIPAKAVALRWRFHCAAQLHNTRLHCSPHIPAAPTKQVLVAAWLEGRLVTSEGAYLIPNITKCRMPWHTQDACTAAVSPEHER
jgi:hypothetical protein